MATSNIENQPHPEQLEDGERNLEKWLEEYGTRLQAIHYDHTTQGYDIKYGHERALKNSEVADLERNLVTTRNRAGQLVYGTADAVKQIMTAASETIPDLLSDGDQQLLATAQQLAAEHGVQFPQVVKTIRQATDKDAVWAAFDITVLHQLQREADGQITDGLDRKRLRQWVSSFQAEFAITAALDAKVYDRLQRVVQADDWDATGNEVYLITNEASYRSLVDTIRASVDLAFFHKLQAAQGESRPTLESILYHSSGQVAMDAFKKAFIPKVHESEQDTQVNLMVNRVVAADPATKWLKSYNPEAIKTVVDDVKKLRKEAANNGNAITDTDIYRLYRSKIETSNVDGKGTADSALTADYQILEALMGRSVKGKLPF